jgi:hypothetical protein
MLKPPQVEEPKPEPTPEMTKEEGREIMRQMREEFPQWFKTPPAPTLPATQPMLLPPRSMLLLPRPDKPHPLLRED